jgi:hypothetical protein
LSDSIRRLSVLLYFYQRRRGRQVAIPKIVMNKLVMPDQLPSFGFESEQAISVKIVSQSVCAVEIKGSRPSRREHQAFLPIERQSRPGIRSTDSFVGVFRPSVVARFAG